MLKSEKTKDSCRLKEKNGNLYANPVKFKRIILCMNNKIEKQFNQNQKLIYYNQNQQSHIYKII